MAQSTDDGETFTYPQRVDIHQLGVCACCALNATFEEPNRVSILYRVAEGGTNRGMAYLTSGDDGQTLGQ